MHLLFWMNLASLRLMPLGWHKSCWKVFPCLPQSWHMNKSHTWHYRYKINYLLICIENVKVQLFCCIQKLSIPQTSGIFDWRVSQCLISYTLYTVYKSRGKYSLNIMVHVNTFNQFSSHIWMNEHNYHVVNVSYVFIVIKITYITLWHSLKLCPPLQNYLPHSSISLYQICWCSLLYASVNCWAPHLVGLYTIYKYRRGCKDFVCCRPKWCCHVHTYYMVSFVLSFHRVLLQANDFNNVLNEHK